MTNFDTAINLPTDNLKERRSLLEAELKKTVVAQVEAELKEKLEIALSQTEIKITKISWDFYPESDDEGGSVYYPEGVSIYNEDGYMDDEDFEGIEIKEKSKYSDTVYSYDVYDYVRDTVSEFSSDLYDYDIYEILF